MSKYSFSCRFKVITLELTTLQILLQLPSFVQTFVLPTGPPVEILQRSPGSHGRQTYQYCPFSSVQVSSISIGTRFINLCSNTTVSLTLHASPSQTVDITSAVLKPVDRVRPLYSA